MALNSSFYYRDGQLYADNVAVSTIAQQVGTPVYIYSLKQALGNLRRIRDAYTGAGLKIHLHYSMKANANLMLLKAIIQAGAGLDAVSGGEIYRAIAAGAKPENIVFAGVGKSSEEIYNAVERGIGWFNVENVAELQHIQQAAEKLGRERAQIALRLNPEVTASTHPYIATGHGGAKFGLTADVIRDVLAHQDQYPRLRFAGLHIHIGSQLGETSATRQAVEKALAIIEPYPEIRTLNIGGGMPAAYRTGQDLPSFGDFAREIAPLLKDYEVLLEPGRAIIADAGILVGRVLYVKEQAGQTYYITDTSMTELIRPALYKATHEVVPLKEAKGGTKTIQLAGPVCETSDMLAHDIALPAMQTNDYLALLTAGAYGMVMSSNYNARTRPPEVVISEDGNRWHVARPRETWDDLIRAEVEALAQMK
jgi:diaminopimelate decarboxylase